MIPESCTQKKGKHMGRRLVFCFGATATEPRPWFASLLRASCSEQVARPRAIELSYHQRACRSLVWAGFPRSGDQLPPEPLALPAFIVQNGRALS